MTNTVTGGTSAVTLAVISVHVTECLRNQAEFTRLNDLAAGGKLTLRVAETFPPEGAAEAHCKLAAGGVRGRLLIVF